jgi:hypothetical protein
MTEETKTKPVEAKKAKAPALEDKPFGEFIEQHFQPTLKSSLEKLGIRDLQLNFQKAKISVVGFSDSQEYWQIIGSWEKGQKQFNLYFLEENINGQKAFSCAANEKKPSTMESFMIDERKVTLDLMILYTLQRLNGQKWLTRN